MKKTFDNIKKFVTVKEGSDATINFITIALALFGLVMVVSASMTASNNSTRILLSVTLKQAIYFFISYVFMVAASKLFSHKLARVLIMPVSLGMIVLLLSTLLFKEVGGAQAWLRFNVGSTQFTIQPSEFAKVSSFILIAMYFGDLRYNTKRTPSEIIRPIIGVVLIQAFIIAFLQNDLGSAIVLVLNSLLVAFIPSHPKLRRTQNVLMAVTVLGIGLSVFLLSDKGLAFIASTNRLKSYQLARFADYANPFLNLDSSGFQLAGSLVSFSRGGLFGVGLGQSIQKYGYLPEVRTDFILPLIAEELGFVGVLVLFLFYALLIYRLIYFGLKVKSEKDKMILMGTVIFLFLHFLLNVGGVSAAIPLTGVPLLLISSGGSSTMAIMLAIGICQSIISNYKKGLEK